nr:hypothetical protein [Desulfobulbaceae bacterium]
MRKNIFTLLVLLLFLSLTSYASACVGRTLYIGSLSSTEDTIMSEMLALLINERTGTTVQTRYFKTNDELYAALSSSVEEERVDILVEDTSDALAIIKKDRTNNPDQDYLVAKEHYDKNLNVIWLNPFGYGNSKGDTTISVSAPLVRRDVLTNFPLLPRVLNKLAGAITDKAYQNLAKDVSSGEKPKNAAKDFLRKKKFI